MHTTKPFAAIAHTRSDYQYSVFHQNLLHENPAENYALKHIYSLENCKVLLSNWGWSQEDIKTGINYATIDVYEHFVYLHIRGWITKRNNPVKIRGISRFISKIDFISVLVNRAWGKADPYKLEPGNDWDELIAKGNTGDFYELKLTSAGVTCTCYAYQGLEKAFEQDAVAAKHLIDNKKAGGQLPDKHCFAVWKYLGADNQQQYEFQFMERRDRFLEETKRSEWSFEPEPDLEAVEF